MMQLFHLCRVRLKSECMKRSASRRTDAYPVDTFLLKSIQHFFSFCTQ